MVHRSYKHPNHYLTEQQEMSIYHSVSMAFKNGVALNRHFTLILKDTLAENKPQAFLTHIMDNTRKWLKRRSLDHAFLWVLENGRHKGIHVHLLLHIPSGYQIEYKRTLKKWLSQYDVSDLKVSEIKYPPFGDLHPLSPLNKLIAYLCKGCETSQKSRTKYQGAIYGRRWGTNINKPIQGENTHV